MARDYIDIGSTPANEECAQVGSDNYYEKARKECATFIGQIRREFGPEPGSARLGIKGNPHDFGTYYEVVCYYDDNDETGMDYAFKCESSAPDWDAESRAALGLT
jgi:hypothetical protein